MWWLCSSQIAADVGFGVAHVSLLKEIGLTFE
jgi:hypothetical protein